MSLFGKKAENETQEEALSRVFQAGMDLGARFAASMERAASDQRREQLVTFKDGVQALASLYMEVTHVRKVLVGLGFDLNKIEDAANIECGALNHMDAYRNDI